MNGKINPLVLSCPTIPPEDAANSQFGAPINYCLKSIFRNVRYHLLLSNWNYGSNEMLLAQMKTEGSG